MSTGACLSRYLKAGLVRETVAMDVRRAQPLTGQSLGLKVFALEVSHVPEQQMIQILASYSVDKMHKEGV